jgi:hypothetical protein
MRIAIHPRLVEEAVFHACRASAARGDPAPGEWLRRALERAYSLPEGTERDLRFERVHGVAFRRMGLARALHSVFAAHPALARAEGPVRVGPAPGPAKEGVDLHGRREDDGRAVRSVVASLLPATLADPDKAARRLHRDASKTADLLDPAFGWREEAPEPTPARRESVRLRYGAAWDAWTDGRLERRGLPVPVPQDRALGDFAAVFAPALGEEGTGAAFRALRDAPSLTHDDILRWARDPSGLPGAGTGTDAGDRAPRGGVLPGSPCPFCRFPTHDWVLDPAALPPGVLAAARGSDPDWEPDRGLCGQCALLFAGRVRKTDSLTRSNTTTAL